MTQISPPDGSADRPASRTPSRRSLLVGASALAAAAALPALPADATTRGRVPAPTAPRVYSADPLFTLGVASGDPLPDRVVLWTRLAPTPTAPDGGMGSTAVQVDWQVARDEGFTRVVRSGSATASPRFAHSVHVDVDGLLPDHWYYYRFRAMGQVSPVGRTRTTPRFQAWSSELKLAAISCQDFQNGYYTAHAALGAEDLDLVLFLGDYIYEYDPASVYPDRLHTTPETPGLDQLKTLGDYRARYGQYKSDLNLQSSHAAFPWIVVWDDHEVENNYANLDDEQDDTGAMHQDPAQFAVERANAYQAWWEHQPVRVKRSEIGTANMRIYRNLFWGKLARFYALDTRQYRSNQPGSLPNDLGPAVLGTLDPTSSMAGGVQESWLADSLSRSRSIWDLLVNQTMVGRFRFPDPSSVGTGVFPPAAQALANLDEWDGYSAFRKRTLAALASRPNPVIFSGDIHSTWVHDLRLDVDDTSTPIVATEYVCSSISSSFFVPDAFIQLANSLYNPDAKFFNGVLRGYVRSTVTPRMLTTDIRVVDTIATPISPVSTLASFVTEAGHPGALPA